jgi:hypothetical protein
VEHDGDGLASVAKLLFDQHGDEAGLAELLVDEGDILGSAIWLRITAAKRAAAGQATGEGLNWGA